MTDVSMHDDRMDALPSLRTTWAPELAYRAFFAEGWVWVVRLCGLGQNVAAGVLTAVLGMAWLGVPEPVWVLFLFSGFLAGYVVLSGLLRDRAAAITRQYPAAQCRWRPVVLELDVHRTPAPCQ